MPNKFANIEFQRNNVTIPSNGLSNVIAKIHVFPNQSFDQQFSILHFASASLPFKKLSYFYNKSIIPNTFFKNQIISKQLLIPIRIPLEVSIYDKILQFFDKTEGLLTFIGGVITGNIGKWIYEKIRFKSNRNV